MRSLFIKTAIFLSISGSVAPAFGSLVCKSVDGRTRVEVELANNRKSAILSHYYRGDDNAALTILCRFVSVPVTPEIQEVVWCQQPGEGGYRVRVLEPDLKGDVWVRLTAPGFLGRTLEKGFLKCQAKTSMP